MFNSIILETIKIIKIIIFYCIKKFIYKTQIFIYFEKQYIKDIYFTLLTIAIFILIVHYKYLQENTTKIKQLIRNTKREIYTKIATKDCILQQKNN